MDSSEAIRLIRSGKKGRDQVITELYQNAQLYDGVKKYVRSNGGSEEDFRDVYNQVLMQFVKTVLRRDDLQIKSNLTTYLIGVARYTWYGVIRDRKKHQHEVIDTQLNIASGASPVELVIDMNQRDLIASLLVRMGKNCKEILLLWANGVAMKEIAQQLNYKSEMMARKKKYKCFKALTDYIEANPHIKEILR